MVIASCRAGLAPPVFLEDKKMYQARISSLSAKITGMLVLLLIGSSAVVGKTIHVKAGAGGDGSSWSNAYGDLHTALDNAEPNDRIWVAAGTFSTGGTPFQMLNGVEIYAGFPDTGDPNLSDRNPGTYVTILHGNNSHVFFNNNLDPNAVLDGFTITGGTAAEGAGMYNNNSDPTIINCTFSSNKTNSGSYGSGTYCYLLPDCPDYACYECIPLTESGNGGNGAGMYNKISSPTLINCTFKGNRTGSGGSGGDSYEAGPGGDGGSGGDGGGMYNHYSSPTLINCAFLDNGTGSGGSGGEGIPGGDGGNGGNGAGMYSLNSSPVLINCTFNGNVTGDAGDGAFAAGRNGYPGSGGGMYNNSESSPVVTNCIFWGDWGWGGEIVGSSATVAYSDVQGGYPGIGNINSIPFSVCSTVRLAPDSPCIDAADNTAVPGYILTDLEGSPRFIDDPNTTDTGKGTPPIVDMGAYEYDPLGETSPYSGSGTAADPYQIWSGAEFSAIRCHPEDWDKHFRLMNDIDLSEYKGHPIYNIIGYEVTGGVSRPFTGVFDGDGHTISGFEYYDSGGPIGLFGYVAGEGEIKNLGLIDPNVVSPIQSYTGSLVGKLKNAKVTVCYVEGGYIQGENLVGGLVGFMPHDGDGGEITDCYSTADVAGYGQIGGLVGGIHADGGVVANCFASGGSVKGSSSVGGLVGYLDNSGVIIDSYVTSSVEATYSKLGGLVGHIDRSSIVRRCYATGAVKGTGLISPSWHCGGLVGLSSSGVVADCYATGSVTGDDYLGGLVGNNNGATISNCYATGSVTGGDSSSALGGLCGRNEGTISNCFWDVVTSGQSSSAGGTGLPTSLMQTRSTFTNAGWDFVRETANGTDDIWRLCENPGHYPQLAWVFPVGDFVCPDGVDFFDYSFFAGHWAEDNCAATKNCDGTDLDLLGTVDIYDLRLFVDSWLLCLPPGKARNPNPPDGAGIGNLDADLSWTAGAGATSHDVYFGTSNPPPFIQNQFATIYDPNTMQSQTTYFWRIDERNNGGKTTGVVWSFSTLMPPPP